MLNCALHEGLIRRRIAYPTQKISFTHPPSPGSFHDQIFFVFSLLLSPSQLGFLFEFFLVDRGFGMFMESCLKMLEHDAIIESHFAT